eukprot:2659904-Alexandrium_andersonii.AAC.1
MSASLVGSEMCIRDRIPPPPKECIRRAPEALLGGPGPPPVRAQEGARGKPVSYTHLTLPTICSV